MAEKHENDPGIKSLRIDWDYDPDAIMHLRPYEIVQHLVQEAEKAKRIRQALGEIGRKLDQISPRGSDDISHSAELELILNPDEPQSPASSESTQP